MVSNPRATAHNLRANEWLEQLLDAGRTVVVPEIADYEVRRELLRAGRQRGLETLDALTRSLAFLPLDSLTMQLAAEYWARSRRHGRPTAPDAALDCDVILAAQAARCASAGDTVMVATTNIGHLAQFADARPWHEVA